MTIEHAIARSVSKPWGSTDLGPWHEPVPSGASIGEVWFERPAGEQDTSLLLKLLFTTAPLSIQVHPDDVLALAMGLPNGKTEAWYILSAAPDAQIAIGLKEPATAVELRAAIEDGSIVDRVRWQPVRRGEIYLIPAGTIHAIGAGIVLAEIQQRSDVTFRLFDFGRQRELHVDQAVAATHVQPWQSQNSPEWLSDNRTVLVANPYFVLERIDLQPGSWLFEAGRELWLLVIEGDAHVDKKAVRVGDAFFARADKIEMLVDLHGVTVLIAYPGPHPYSHLRRVQDVDDDMIHDGSQRTLARYSADERLAPKPEDAST
jgi:mannose-6-phosphate isomerase